LFSKKCFQNKYFFRTSKNGRSATLTMSWLKSCGEHINIIYR
jgi:hypothetical protein